LILIIS